MHGPICKLFSREAFLASPQIRVIKQSCWRGFPLQLLEFWEGGTAREKKSGNLWQPPLALEGSLEQKEEKNCLPLLLLLSWSHSRCPGASAESPSCFPRIERTVRPRADAKAAAGPLNSRASPAAAEVEEHSPPHNMLWGRRKEGLWPCLLVLIDGFCCSYSHF